MVEHVVLVVDTDGEVSVLLQDIVKNDDCTVLSVTCGNDALTQARERLPNALVINADAPEGLKACQVIKTEPALSTIPLVLLSDPDGAELDLATLPPHAQPDHHLLRPIEKKAISDVIASCLLNKNKAKIPGPPPVPTKPAKTKSIEERVEEITQKLFTLESAHRELTEENKRLFSERKEALDALAKLETGESPTKSDEQTLEKLNDAIEQANARADRATDAEQLAKEVAKTAQNQLEEAEKNLENIKEEEEELRKELKERDVEFKNATKEKADLVIRIAELEEKASSPKEELESLRKEMSVIIEIIQQCAIDLAETKEQIKKDRAQAKTTEKTLRKFGKIWEQLDDVAKGINQEAGMRSYGSHLYDVLLKLKENLRDLRLVWDHSNNSRERHGELVEKMYKTLTSDRK